MQVFQLHYYCYGCQNRFTSHSQTFSCLTCDSSAILNCQFELSTQHLSEFRPFELKSVHHSSHEPLGFLENQVNPIRNQNQQVYTVFSRTIYRVTVNDLDDQITSLRFQFPEIGFLQALLGEAEEGVSEEEMSQLEKVNHVYQCSICQESHEVSIEDTHGSNEGNQDGYKLICGHIFHKQCIRPWFQKARTCPLCRKSISGEE